MKKFRIIYSDTRKFTVEIEVKDEDDAIEKSDKYIAENSDEWFYDDEDYDVVELIK